MATAAAEAEARAALAAAVAQKHDGRAAVEAALAREDCTAAVLNATLWTGPLALALREACGTGVYAHHERGSPFGRKPGEALAEGDTVVLAPGATGVEGLGQGEGGAFVGEARHPALATQRALDTEEAFPGRSRLGWHRRRAAHGGAT